MIKPLLCATLLCIGLATTSLGQNAITLTNVGYAENGTDTVWYLSNPEDFSTLGQPLEMGNWDLSSAEYGTAGVFNRMNPAINPFPAASYALPVFFVIGNSGLAYDVDLYHRLGSNGLDRLGQAIPTRQAYSLRLITGNPNDSLVFPVQTIPYAQPQKIIQFPATWGGNWISNSSNSTAFSLTVASFGLNNTPGERRSVISTTDTVVGYGKMKVPVASAGKESVWVDVLQVRSRTIVTDSFYLGGSPAPAQLLTAFGISQNMKDTVYLVRFFRQGEITPLAEADYGTAEYIGQPQDIFISQTNLQPVGIHSINGPGIQATLFPNPTSGEVNLRINSELKGETRYILTNSLGQQVAGDKLALQSGAASFSLPNSLIKGLYFITIINGSSASGTMPLSVQ